MTKSAGHSRSSDTFADDLGFSGGAGCHSSCLQGLAVLGRGMAISITKFKLERVVSAN